MRTTKSESVLFLLSALCVLGVKMSCGESHVVFVTGDDEYASQLSMPMIARILEARHGMKTTVLYATNERGERDHTAHNIPGTEALAEADAAVFFMRWRELPQEQLNAIIRYAESGKPMLGLRTSSHALKYPGPPNDKWNDGFGRQFFGQKWIVHYGHHNSTLAHVVPAAKDDPVLRGVEPELWLHSWLYVMNHGEERLPRDCRVLLEGDAIEGDKPGGEQFGERQPMAWTRELPRHRGDGKQRIFYTSLGHPRDFNYDSPRRLLVNAIYWALGREVEIPPGGADVEIVGEYDPPDPK
jgi:type 1 glutamine amidotransferase